MKQLRADDRWPVELLGDLCQLWADRSLTIAAIAERLDVSPTVLKAKLAQLDWKRPPHETAALPRPSTPQAGTDSDTRGRPIALDWTPARRGQLKRLYLEDRFAIAVIAERLGISANAVANEVDRLSLQRPALPRGPKPDWQDRDAMLRRLWCDEGLTYGEIAARLGTSRSAVSGRIQRLALPKRANRERPKRRLRVEPFTDDQATILRTLWTSTLTIAEIASKVGRTERDCRKEANRQQLPKRTWRRGVRTPEQKKRRALAAAGKPSKPKAAAITFAPKRGRCQLTDTPDRHHCHFPIGNPDDAEFRFCGDEVAVVGASYCAEHMRVCYQAMPPIEGSEAA